MPTASGTLKLSIIMRCHNRLEYTIRSIVSIDERSGLEKNEYEIICVNQASDDGTKEWLDAACGEGYYPIRPIHLDENVGDGRGMQIGIEVSNGEFISQHDNDLEIVTEGFYRKLLLIYKLLESKGKRVCALGGSHIQVLEHGIKQDEAPMKFARDRYNKPVPSVWIRTAEITATLYYSSWVRGIFVFDKKFTSHKFGKGMCNSWCGYWWDEGFNNMFSSKINYWHIDSTSEGGEYVIKQNNKFPSYTYIKKHYRRFIK